MFPTKLSIAKSLQLNVTLDDNKMMLDGKAIEWFKDGLNDMQQQAVVESLRGECRPLPFIIYGPPVSESAQELLKYLNVFCSNYRALAKHQR